MNLYKEFTLLELDGEFHEVLVKDFKELSKVVPSDKIKDYLQKSRNAFPGIGDIKEKSDLAYGDFLIFHELMNYAKEKQTDIIFLTYDNTKGDWFDLNKKPLIHYLENFYLNTGQHLFILDADRFFKHNLETDFKSIVIETTEFKSYSQEELANLLRYYFQIEGKIDGYELANLIEEFKFNGILNIEDLYDRFDVPYFKDYLEYFRNLFSDKKYRKTDIIRHFLKMSYSDYKTIKLFLGVNGAKFIEDTEIFQDFEDK